MIELLIAAGFVLVPLFLTIPLLGKYLDLRASAVQTARYAAWERTVWYGGDAASSLGWFGVSRRWHANEKSDDQIRSEIAVRLLSDTSPEPGASFPLTEPPMAEAFSSIDRSANAFRGNSKKLWQDRNEQALLAEYKDVANSVINNDAPGTLNKVLKPIAEVGATLGPFTLEMRGAYAATVTMQVRDIDYDHFLAKSSTTGFRETNVLLANGWNADGPNAPDKTSVLQQTKGLVPFSIFKGKIGDIPVMEYLQTAMSVFLPEVSKLDLGKIEPEAVPADRLGDK